MTVEKPIRELIKFWVEQGFEAPQIVSLLKGKVSKATVYRWIKRLSTTGIGARKQPGRPRSKQTMSFIQYVKRNVVMNKKKKSA